MNNQVLLTVSGLWKTFEKGGVRIDVLKGIDLTVSKGERVGIVGVSGAGKTTLLQIIGGLDRPTRGKVIFQGKDVFSLKEDELADFRRDHVGFVYQSYNLLPEFNALENVMIPFIINGVSREEAAERAKELLRLVGLEERTLHRTGELSGGEQQRVAIARAVALRPSLILADEPTGNLDRETGKKVLTLLLDLVKRDGCSLILVTHDERIVKDFDRVVRIDDGRIVEE
ncbi:MAG: ABC transporter ATP-binding protein [Deltaproteobacteria bacterium]|nr:MAG: ABC transporter ATP-binding protein [Deltaproteobacteria bacterium]